MTQKLSPTPTIQSNDMQMLLSECRKVANNILLSEINKMDEQEILLAKSFIHYFYNNPDAYLFIVGQIDPYLGNDTYDGCGVFRVDQAYVQEYSSKQSTTDKPEKQSITAYDPTLFRKSDGRDGLPKQWQNFRITEFDEFKRTRFVRWEKIGHFNHIISLSGMVYGKENLHELLEHFKIDPLKLISEVERERLLNETKPEPVNRHNEVL